MADFAIACMRNGDLKALEKYIENLDSINDYVYEDGENKLTLLHLAVGLDSSYRDDVVEILIEHHADLNCPGRNDNIDNIRALHVCSMWGYDVTIKLLLIHGADASLRDSNGLSPVDYASIFDNYLCVSLLLTYGHLNATTAAWQSIMETSYGESVTNSSLEDCLYLTALDLGGGDDSRTDTDSTRNGNLKHPESIKASDPVVAAHAVAPDAEDADDFDALDLIKDDDIDIYMDDCRLRLELRKLGHNPGPITATTKRVYAKLLAHLMKADKEIVYSPRTTNKSQLSGHSLELSSIITGRFAIKQALGLEREFISLSGSRDYHGPKQFFNYILIDPRISKNVPEQAIEASDSDTSGTRLSPNTPDPCQVMSKVNRKFNPKLFAQFISSIFYIGKGQKRRDLMHLFDALADRGSITQKKIDRIRSIWDDGYGVVSLHLFHNITSKEALTREAIMIETIGLDNLTNLLHGTIQFKLGWNEHKRRKLGALLLHRAYTQLLNEGERQLKREDLKKDR